MEDVAADEDFDDVGIKSLFADGAFVGLCVHGNYTPEEEFGLGAQAGCVGGRIIGVVGGRGHDVVVKS
jgi:hypothetical protein